MEQHNTPIIHISGIIQIKDYVALIRERGLRMTLYFMVFYIVTMLLTMLGLDLHYAYPYLREGHLTIVEWLSEAFSSLIHADITPVIILLLVLYALYAIQIRPVRAGKRLRELYPEGALMSYDFYADQLVLNTSSSSNSRTTTLKYSDVQRKIRQSKHFITLRTNLRNSVSLYKVIMTPEEITNITALLQANCPQRKRRS